MLMCCKSVSLHKPPSVYTQLKGKMLHVKAENHVALFDRNTKKNGIEFMQIT